ncbi:hypothetical protein RB598_004722 [Gaeumannomyces tritici]
MCEWTDREYYCGHHRIIAAMWCSKFIRTQLRCQPHVENREYRPHEICSDCQKGSREPVPWDHMINYPSSQQSSTTSKRRVF